MNIRVVGLIFSFIFIGDVLNAQEIIQKSSIDKKPVEYQYFFNSAVARKNESNENLNVEKIGNFLFEYEANQLNSVANQLSNQARYIVVIGTDQSVKFFNGSILVKFNEPPNFESFAMENDLIFVKSLAEIGIGVYRVRDLRTTQSKIQRLSENKNVRRVELDLLDPNIVPN